MAKSIEDLLPDCKPRAHWDFSSTASLVRNLTEAYLLYFWLCQDAIDDDVRDGRFVLLHLHDYGSRRRMFNWADTESDPVYRDLVERFDTNPYLKTFDEKQRRDALKGEKTPFVQDDVLDRLGVEREPFRQSYRFLSQHTHTGPMSFYRMLEHDRGTGVETVHEKRYMIVVIIQAMGVLHAAIAGHLSIFPDAETRPPYLTSKQIESNVERAQGRRR